mgnify:CR=1 FL=1
MSIATTVRIPIDLRSPRVSTLAGNCYWTVLALTNIDFGIWNFVKDVDGRLYGVVTVPAGLAGTVSPAIVLAVGANATSGVTTLNVKTKAVAPDAESVNVTLTADTAQNITVPATARLTKAVTFTVGDLANIVANDILFVEVQHDGTAVADTLAVDTELYEAWLRVDLT